MDRTLPHNLDAEKCVLGAILINNHAFNQAAEIIDAQDFFRDAHRRIFEKMVTLTDKSVPVDLVTLTDELARSSELDEVGGPAYISYKDVKLLAPFIPERGKIQPRRISGVCATHQRALHTAIKRARHLALVPYVTD